MDADIKNQHGDSTGLRAVDAQLNAAMVAKSAKEDFALLDAFEDADFEDAAVVSSRYWESPASGEVKTGVFLGYFQMQSQNNEDEMVLGVRWRGKDGVWVSAAKALSEGMLDGGVDVGDLIRVTCTGKKAVKAGKMFTFEIKKIDRATAQARIASAEASPEN